MNTNIFPTTSNISLTEKVKKLGKIAPQVIWFTGLSGSGKSTFAYELEKQLFSIEQFCVVLDGDNIRSGLNMDLKFSLADREENIRRIAHVCKLLNDQGILVIASFVSPTKKIRDIAIDIIGEDKFKLCFIDRSIEAIKNEDTKGLYKQAEAGKLVNFTGVSAGQGFERPENSVTIKIASLTDLSSKVSEFINTLK